MSPTDLPRPAPVPLPVSSSFKVKPGHLARQAVVYIRQSTMQQVHHNRESTARQYALDRRALQLGWPAEAVVIVDEDQGLSGQTAEGRSGFAYLLSKSTSRPGAAAPAGHHPAVAKAGAATPVA